MAVTPTTRLDLAELLMAVEKAPPVAAADVLGPTSTDAGRSGPARPAPALRYLRLLAGPWAGRPARRGPGLAERGDGNRALDTSELACRHRRSFAKHRTVTDLAHARALRAGRA